MQWIIDNWVLVLLGGGMVAMHMFGHGHGHGRKGKDHDPAGAPDDRVDGAGPQGTEPSGDDRNA